MTKKTQSVLEYSIVIFSIVAALIAMKTYITRGIQGKLRTSVDSLGEQYSPGNTTSNITTSVESETLALTVPIGQGADGQIYTETLTFYLGDKQVYDGEETVNYEK